MPFPLIRSVGKPVFPKFHRINKKDSAHGKCEPKERVAHCSSVKLRGFSVIYDFFEGYVFMKPNMIKKWSIALLVAAGATGLTGCEGMRVDEGAGTATNNGNIAVSQNGAALKANLSKNVVVPVVLTSKSIPHQ